MDLLQDQIQNLEQLIEQVIDDSESLVKGIQRASDRFKAFITRQKQKLLAYQEQLNTTIDNGNKQEDITNVKNRILAFTDNVQPQLQQMLKTYDEFNKNILLNNHLSQPIQFQPKQAIQDYSMILNPIESSNQVINNDFQLTTEQLQNRNPSTRTQRPQRRTEKQKKELTKQAHVLKKQTQGSQSECSSTEEQRTNWKFFSWGRIRKFKYEWLSTYKVTQEHDEKCILCQRRNNSFNSELLHLPSNEQKHLMYPIHEMCALWTNQLTFFKASGKTAHPGDLDDVIEKSLKTVDQSKSNYFKKKCNLCGQRGASLTCQDCDKVFHFPCIMSNDSSNIGKIVEKKFEIFCDDHSRQQQKRSKSQSRKKQPAPRQKTPLKQNTQEREHSSISRNDTPEFANLEAQFNIQSDSIKQVYENINTFLQRFSQKQGQENQFIIHRDYDQILPRIDGSKEVKSE